MANSGNAMDRVDTVIYHTSCNDGFCAAWLCHRHWPEATYISVQYGQPVPDFDYINGKNVIIADFSYERDVAYDLWRRANALIILDHHKTAREELRGLSFCVFDMNKSGARLTFEYLKEIGYEHGDPHWLVDYTEDNDLWRHSLPDSREISTAISSYPREFEVWDEIATRSPHSIAIEGIAIQRYRNVIIESHLRYVRVVTIDGYQAYLVQCTTSDIGSDLADCLLKKDPNISIVIIATDTFDGVVYRLRGNGTIDVSKIAEAYGGGGHKSSAAFKLPDFCRTSRPLLPFSLSQGAIDG